MGKKRKLGQQWPPQNFAELFAWLNHSLEHGAINFTNTILEHLRESCGADYTLAQVDRKFRTSWDSLGWTTDSQYTWKDLYKHGSQILSRLSDEQRESIASAQRRIEDRITARLLSPCARPRTRSASKSDNCLSSPLVSLETFSTKQKSQRYSRALTGSLTPSPAKRESEPVDLGASDSPQPTGRAKKISLLGPKAFSIDSNPTNGDPSRNKRKSGFSITVDIPEVVEDSDVESGGTAEGEDDTKQNLVTEQRQMNGQQIKDKPEGSLEVLPLYSSSELDDSAIGENLDEEHQIFRTKIHLSTPTEVLLRERLDEAIDENKCLRDKLITKECELQAQNNELERVKLQRDLLESAQKERDLSRDIPWEAFTLQKDRYIHKILKELHDRERLGTFTTFSEITPAPRSRKSIQEGFEEIFFNTQTISCQYDRDRPFFVPSLEKYDDLRLLVCEGLGIDPQKTIRDKDTKALLSKLAPQAIIRALTTSALREWIFEGDFPSFGNVTGLFATYRESIAKLDGFSALKQLDLAAHSSVIDGEDFKKHRIPQTAERLAKQLSKTLAPFFVRDPDHPKERDLHGFHKWGQEKEEYQDRQAQFVKIFTSALETKANSILEREDYEMVIYPPGTEFNKATMVAETMGGVPQRNGNFNGRAVELCLDAAVFSHQRGEPGNDVPKSMTEALVQSRNFSHEGKTERQKARLLIPAAVILRDVESPLKTRVSDTIIEDDTSGSLGATPLRPTI